MQETVRTSPLRRWLESILVWYMLFMLIYLAGRFILPFNWRWVGLLNNGAPYFFFPVIIGLVIALLLRSRRILGLYFLMTIVGVLWIGTALIPPFTQAEAQPTALQVATFNVFPDNDSLDDVASWLGAYQPEILALQELPEDLTAFAPLDEAYNYQTTYSNTRLYSQYEIVDATLVQLVNREAQRLVLDINGVNVVVYNVHLLLPFNDNENATWFVLRYDEADRNAEVERLTRLIASESDPVLLFGDFNMVEWSPSYRLLANELNDAYRSTEWGIGATYPANAGATFGDVYPRLFRIDYVMYSDPFIAESAFVGADLGSDHLPVIVNLTMP